jgi:transcriptional regulator with XRE-family HTH domain
MQTRFPETLNQLREQAQLTNRELARLAEVPESLISGLQKGARRVGESNARQIGVALGLTGEDLNNFVLEAIDTSTRKLLKSAQEYPSTLINYLALQLNRVGVTPHLVTDCGFATGGGDKLTLLLADGRVARISTELVVC